MILFKDLNFISDKGNLIRCEGKLKKSIFYVRPCPTFRL